MLENLTEASRRVITEETAIALRLSKDMPFRVDELHEPKRPKPNLSAIIGMIKPAIESHTTPGTKRQKSSYMNYWASFFSPYEINMASFGKMSKMECEQP